MASGNALQEVFARFGVQFDSGPLVQGEGAVNDATTALRTLGNVVAGSALVGGLASFARSMVTLGDDLETQAQLIGVSTDALQEWHHVAALADVSAEQFNGAAIRLQTGMAQGATQVTATFHRLGVSMRDSHGNLRDVSDVLTDLADPLSAVSNDAQRTGYLVNLLGETGARLGPLFANGSEGIRQAREELEALGGGASADFIASASEADDALDRWDVAWLSLRSRLAVYVIPIFTLITTGLTRISAGMARAAEHSRLLEAAFLVLGIAGAAAGRNTAIAWVRAAAPFVALAAAVAALIFIVDDLWVGFEGGESVLLDLGQAFEAWGEGLTGQGGVFTVIAYAIEYVKGLLISFVSTVWDMVNAIGSLVGAGENVAGSNPLADLGANISQEGNPESQAAQRIFDAGHQSPTEFLIPDSLERFMAIEQARQATATGSPAAAPASGGGGPPVVQHSVRIDRIDTTGMTPAEAARMVDSSVSRALARQTDDTVDALT